MKLPARLSALSFDSLSSEKMATTINVNSVNFINSNGVPVPKYEVPVKLVLEYDPDGLSVKIKRGEHLQIL